MRPDVQLDLDPTSTEMITPAQPELTNQIEQPVHAHDLESQIQWHALEYTHIAAYLRYLEVVPEENVLSFRCL